MPISILDALDVIYENVHTVSSQIVPIENAIGEIIQEDKIASFDLPRFDNSAMDGYAVKCSDANLAVEIHPTIVYAGDNPKMTLQANEAIKIMTGAPIPKGTQAVVPIENVTQLQNRVQLPQEIKKNANLRYAGEDIKKDTLYLKKGSKITAYSIALLASQGVTHISVYRPLKVSVFATGDELRPHYEKIENHQLYNSNTPMFLSRLHALGCEVSYVKTSGDTIEALEQSILSSLNADIIITSGGVSMGDKDFTKEAFKNLGMKLHFEKIDIKPGKPTTFGMINQTAIINLPGNPLAAMVNFEIFVRAVIRKMSGLKAYYHQTITTKIAQDFHFRAGKYSVKLGYFDGISFSPFKKQLPGMLSVLDDANAMIVTTPNIGMFEKEESVKIIPISFELSSQNKESLLNTQG